MCVCDTGGEARRKRTLGRPRLKWEDNLNWILDKSDWVYGMD
jgi:hypothetical protein